MRKIIFTAILFVAMSRIVFSQTQDSVKQTSLPVAITGSIDAYYRFNFNNPKTYPYNSPASFTHSSNSFELGMNATLQSVKLDTDSTGKFTSYKCWGAAVYLNIDPVSWFGLTLRGEYIGDNDEYLGLKHVFAPTLSVNFKVNNLTIIPEFRFDNAGNRVFYKSATEITSSTG